MDKLKDFLEEHKGEKTAVAYSGGVDSALIAFYSRAFSEAVLVRTEFTPEHIVDSAREFAEKHSISLKVLDEKILPGLEENPADRCYSCKKRTYQRIRSEGYDVVFDGCNLDDLSEDRPGLSAGKEEGVISPLAELGMGKDEVRRLMEEIDPEMAKKPSDTCLATRVPAGSRITPGRLKRIEEAEKALRALGFEKIRVRDHGSLARIQSDDLSRVLEKKEKIVVSLKGAGYKYITVDLEKLR